MDRRMTAQRQVILEELRRVKTHPSADELYEMVRRRLPRISLGTVYRNLELLAEQGSIARLDAAGGARRFDGDVSEHCHVRCLGCGAVADAGPSPPLGSERPAQAPPGYQITGRRLEFIGYCPVCRASRETAARAPGAEPTSTDQGGMPS